METLESLRKKITGATEIQSVVRTMKTMAAANIGQYEMAVSSLEDYYRTIVLGLIAYFREEKIGKIVEKKRLKKKEERSIGAIVFGSDLGLVGQFNDSLSLFVLRFLNQLPGKKEVWPVGERIQLLLSENGLNTTQLFAVPNSVDAITSLVGRILIKSQHSIEGDNLQAIYLFYNKSTQPAGYEPAYQQLLPLDEKWKQNLDQQKWPGKNLPGVAGGRKSTLQALVSEFLFVSLFKACAESLASENASRLEAMQRAKKNIDEMLEDLSLTFHRLRQETIDEELFDVVSGFEALKDEQEHF
jgi:F-type H+-transporting ATPase subunit gamma